MQKKLTLTDILYQIYQMMKKWNGYPSFLFKKQLKTSLDSFNVMKLRHFAIATSEYLKLQDNPMNSACIDILYNLRKLIFENISDEEFTHFIINSANTNRKNISYIPFIFIIKGTNNTLSLGNVENYVPDMNKSMETFLLCPKNKIAHKILYRNFDIEPVFDFDRLELHNLKFDIKETLKIYHIISHYNYGDISMEFLAYYEMEDRIFTTVVDPIGEV